MGATVLKTKHLTKIYGERKVLSDISLTVEEGDIYGFIGKNGAGKTTFMRTCLGMANKTSGEINFFDENDINMAKRKVGALIECPAIFKNKSAKENLEEYSVLFGGDKNEINDLLEKVDLKNTGKKQAGAFSLGMRQRLGIAISLIAHPKFLILDEPINGLDPEGISKIRNMIISLNHDDNITFLISSHLLDELGKIATKYGILNDGVLIEEIKADDLKAKCQKRIDFVVDNTEKAGQVLKDSFPENDFHIKENVISLKSGIDTVKVNSTFVKAGIGVSEIRKMEMGLEEYFMKKVGLQ